MSMDSQIESAKRDLAARLKIDPATITVKKAKATQWPDASLGVGEPGTGYAMIMVDGFVITLEANGKSYVYHADADRQVKRAP